MRISKIRALAAATLVWMGGPGAALGQTVVGRVLERGGGGPVAGAMVRLLTDQGGAGAGWLTDVGGRFRLAAPRGGTYRIRVERIGFASTVLENVEVPEGGVASVDVVVESDPIVLEGIEVSAVGGRCESDERGASAQTLWDEARKALAAASWTQAEGGLRFSVTAWDREISARTSQVFSEQLERRVTVGDNSVQSLEPDRLVEDGYVQSRQGLTYYYAPDAEALLSDEFQETHCFGVVEDDGRGSPYVGLSFEPDEGRELPDVRGVIWLDAVSGRLDRVEFRYTRLDVPGAARARGEVRFAELPTGQWIVRDWFIRAPMVVARRQTPVLGPADEAGIHEVGNSVDLVEGQDLVWRPDIASGTIRGTVYDSVSASVLAGADVRVGGRNLRTRVDPDGSFELTRVPPGLYRITFAHPRLDSLGVTPGWSSVRVEPGGISTVELTVPSWKTLLARSCGAVGAGALIGFVYDREGRRVPGVTVEALGVRDDDGRPARVTSDMRGGFVFCDLPVGVVRIAARRPGFESEAVETRTRETTFVQADATLRPVIGAPEIPSALRPGLVGTVMERTSRRPLEDVSVSLLGPDGAVLASTLTDSDGHFGMVLDEGVQVHLSVSRLGYTGSVSDALDLREGTRRIEVLLPEEAIALDPIVVEVGGRVPRLERVGFYERAVTHPGTFIQRDDVEAVAPARTSDLLGRVPGVRVTTHPLEGDLRRRVVFNRIALVDGDRCYPTVFVDGQMERMGGSRSESQAPAIQGVEPPPGEDVQSIDEMVPPQEILGVEMYENPAQLPSRFIGLGTHCGAIVIWTTRER